MNTNITVVMYHYVRKLRDSKYPEIKGLELDLFLQQLDFFSKEYNFISIENILSGELPNNPILLTFDDGYADIYENIFPILLKRKIQGVFAPIVDASFKHSVLDVNKIHFVLASVEDKTRIVDYINQLILEQMSVFELESPNAYWNRSKPSRYDSKEVVYIKTMLQHALPKVLRGQIVNDLFKKFVTSDEKEFSKELYVSLDQLREMHSYDMAMSIHGSTHSWLSKLSKQEQEVEIKDSLKFMDCIGVKRDRVSITYPYGDYNSITIEICKEHNINLGFTTRVAPFNYSNDNLLEIPRFDTNDFYPKKK